MDNKEKENEVNLLSRQQKELNERLEQQLQFNVDFIWELLKDRENARKNYLEAITKIVAFIVIPLVTMMSIFFVSYFFSDYEDYDDNSTTETYTSSNVIKDTNLSSNSNIDKEKTIK